MRSEIRQFLDEKVNTYNRSSFIQSDPIQVPHRFDEKHDIEIAALLTATLSWGKRSIIIDSANSLLNKMPGGPYHFLMNSKDAEFQEFIHFVHRTFNGYDCIYFLKSIRNIYLQYGGIGSVFIRSFEKHNSLFDSLAEFRRVFFSMGGGERTKKHVADVLSGSAAKRLNMFLRWMIRRDDRGVDLGIWEEIPMSALYIPLDVHTGSTARKLGLLTRKQNDWKAVLELTGELQKLDPEDPIKYDYALFGLGVFEKF